MPRGTFRLLRAGLVEYRAAWDLQRRLADEVRGGARPALLLLEHPPVFTLGRNADRANVLDAGPIPVVEIDRGGDVTYHGPGQLVGYPILSLRERRLGAREHVERLERAIVAVLALYGVPAATRPSEVGVWSARGKIAALGVRIERGVTMHGFALNVATDPAPFRRIHPCGVAGAAVTTLSEELGRPAAVADAIDRFVPRFAEEFRFTGWDERGADPP